MSVAFLVNPASGNGSTGRRWPELAHRAAEAGLEGPTFMSSRRGELPRLVEQAASEGPATVVAVGGDGTVNEVVAGLMSVRDRGSAVPELAVLPSGTGTDFARTFRLPSDLGGAISVAGGGALFELDIGRVEYSTWSGARAVGYFANVASAGMSGAIARRADTTSRALGGKVAYLAATIAVFVRWKPSTMAVRAGDEERHGLMRDVIVANCRFVAGGMKICPEAEPDDGVFDVLLLGNLTKTDLALTMPKLYRGTHLPHPRAELLRASWVSVESPTSLPIQLDGEQPGTTPARFEVVPKALRLRVPHGLELP